MPLCSIGDALDLGERETRLAEYDGMLAKAERGCEACKFFCDILRPSSDREWFRGHIVFLLHLRLDCKKPEELSTSTHSADKLAFDLCKPEGSTDVYSITPCT